MHRLALHTIYKQELYTYIVQGEREGRKEEVNERKKEKKEGTKGGKQKEWEEGRKRRKLRKKIFI